MLSSLPAHGRGKFPRLPARDVVWLKKYLYVLRPICACRWIERGLGPVPMEFSKLVNKTIDDVMLRFAIADLVVRKRNGEELDRAPRVPVISEFVESELARLADIEPEKTDPLPVTELDAFFRNTFSKPHENQRHPQTGRSSRKTDGRNLQIHLCLLHRRRR